MTESIEIHIIVPGKEPFIFQVPANGVIRIDHAVRRTDEYVLDGVSQVDSQIVKRRRYSIRASGKKLDLISAK